jgi:shikimate kinase
MKNALNIVLVGMPGSGKSTVGVILAKKTSYEFVDTDLIIQFEERRSLQDIVDSDGYMELRCIEERVLSSLNVQNHVISTGGSAVYSDKSMVHLKKNAIVVFLDVSLEVLERRVKDYSTRGLAKRPEQSFEELFEERCALYRKYADVIIDCNLMNQEEVCNAVIDQI